MADPSTYLFTQGVLGVACLVLGGVCVKLYKKCEALSDKIEALHDKRLADSNANTEKIIAFMQDYAETNRILTEKIDVAKGKR